MTVQETLRECFVYYSSIFPNKWAVYHHWFCVNGNGYKWIDGELVDISDSCVDVLPELTLEEEIERRTSDFTPKREIYPLCEYAKILNIPDDIKPDWKEAVIEFATWLLNSDIEIKKEYREYLTNFINNQ